MTLNERKLMELGLEFSIPVFRYLREWVEQTESAHLEALAQLRNGHGPAVPLKKRGRPSKASKTILDAVAAAAALAAPEEPTEVVPVAVKKSKARVAAGKGRWAKFKTKAARSAEMKRIMSPKKKAKTKVAPEPDKGTTYVVADLAKQIGYKGTWGLSVWLREHNIPQHYEKRQDAKGTTRRTAVLTQKNFMKMMKLREKKFGMKALNKIAEGVDVNTLQALERATAA